VNPRLHDEFVALCALFYSGEITDEEWALLQVHMAYCDSCRRTFEEFKHVAKEVMPSMASAAAAESANAPRESAATLEDAERRLMSRLATIPAPEQTLVSKKRSRALYAGALAACAVVLLAFVGAHYLPRKMSAPERTDSSVVTAPNATPLAAPPLGTADQTELKRDEVEIAGLRQQIDAPQQGAKGFAHPRMIGLSRPIRFTCFAESFLRMT
jgi:anti-sigma factor RsiW